MNTSQEDKNNNVTHSKERRKTSVILLSEKASKGYKISRCGAKIQRKKLDGGWRRRQLRVKWGRKKITYNKMGYLVHLIHLVRVAKGTQKHREAERQA